MTIQIFHCPDLSYVVPFDDGYNLLLANILFNRIPYAIDFDLERVSRSVGG